MSRRQARKETAKSTAMDLRKNLFGKLPGKQITENAFVASPGIFCGLS